MSQTRRDLIAAEVARLLKEARLQKALSMTQLAAKAGLSLAIISLIERGLRNPTLETLLRITEILEVELSEVLAEAERSISKRPRR